MTATAAAGIGAVVLALAAVAGARQPYGSAFPTAALRRDVSITTGCVSTDDPLSLIELDLLRQNLSRHCPLVVDLGGYSYYLQPRKAGFLPRKANLAWQRLAIDYLGSGDRVVVLRFGPRFGFDRTSARQVRRWPLIRSVDGVDVRRPGHRTGQPFSAAPHRWSSIRQ